MSKPRHRNDPLNWVLIYNPNLIANGAWLPRLIDGQQAMASHFRSRALLTASNKTASGTQEPEAGGSYFHGGCPKREPRSQACPNSGRACEIVDALVQKDAVLEQRCSGGLRPPALLNEDEEHSRHEDEQPNERKDIPPDVACHDLSPKGFRLQLATHTGCGALIGPAPFY
jgi:hypothetical protein